MIEYLLDTNAVIDLLGNKSDALARRFARTPTGAIGTSSVVAHELYFGAYKSGRVAYNLETLRLLFADLGVLDYDREDARAAGEIRAHLQSRGQPIGPYDILIAGQAKARNLVLVTNNVGEFNRIENLRVEDWTLA